MHTLVRLPHPRLPRASAPPNLHTHPPWSLTPQDIVDAAMDFVLAETPLAPPLMALETVLQLGGGSERWEGACKTKVVWEIVQKVRACVCAWCVCLSRPCGGTDQREVATTGVRPPTVYRYGPVVCGRSTT